MKIAVIAHSKKSVGGGLPALRTGLVQRGHPDVDWHEVSKSRKLPKALARALESGPDLVIVWGGGGMVQQAVDTLARKGAADVALAVIPAGTSNLFASNLGIAKDIHGALDIALGGTRKRVDVGVFNGERFAVMAGVGFDALMIRDASGALKDRFGRAAYIMTAAKNLHGASTRVSVDVDGSRWFTGRASCVIVGNVGSLIGGIELFEHADPTDDKLDIAVVRAERLLDWARLAARALAGHANRSPLLASTTGRKIDLRLDRRLPYELDGGERGTTKKVKVRLRHHAINVCVPTAE
jgi:diacylglycerol kinase (ATP)